MANENRRPAPKIGLDMLYAALVLADNEAGTEYGAPVRLSGLSSIGYDPSTQTAAYDADDGTYASYSADGEVTATIKVADLLPEHTALLLGLSQTAQGVLEESGADAAPELALGFRTQKSDGSYRFYWLLKGKFARSGENYATKSGQGISYSDRELKFSVLNRVSDGKKRRMLDSNSPQLPEGVTLELLSHPEKGWFSHPDYTPAAP